MCVCVGAVELELGLKKEGVLSSDGSSLEALLKAEAPDKRGAAEARPSEEEPSLSDYTPAPAPSARSRRVCDLRFLTYK